jgi:hypothetical protein
MRNDFCNESRKQLCHVRIREIAMAHTFTISKLKESRGKVSKDMIVQLTCVGVMMSFAVMWVLLGTLGGRTRFMSPVEIEERMDEFARKYIETHDKEIARQLYRLAGELEKVEKEKKQ